MEIKTMEVKNYFICPISHQIFAYPVMATDGYFYEKSQIKKWFKNNNKSPMTNLEITNELHVSYIFNNMLENYLDNNPTERHNRFDASKTHAEFTKKIHNFIKTKNFNKLYDKDLLISLLKCKNSSVINHFIDNIIDLEKQDENSVRPIHYVAEYCNTAAIKYLIGKQINMECVTDDG